MRSISLRLAATVTLLTSLSAACSASSNGTQADSANGENTSDGGSASSVAGRADGSAGGTSASSGAANGGGGDAGNGGHASVGGATNGGGANDTGGASPGGHGGATSHGGGAAGGAESHGGNGTNAGGNGTNAGGHGGANGGGGHGGANGGGGHASSGGSDGVGGDASLGGAGATGGSSAGASSGDGGVAGSSIAGSASLGGSGGNDETGGAAGDADVGGAAGVAGDSSAGGASSGSSGSGGALSTAAPILMHRNDLSRTGANVAETTLTASNVTDATFGSLFTRDVDDEVYAQILYVPNLDFGARGVHDAIFAATMNDTLYAFDATDPTASTPLWQTSFLDPANGIVALTHNDVGLNCHPYLEIDNHIGILSTPTIDVATSTIYVLSRVKDSSGAGHQHLHALELTTGEEKPGSPVEIQASVSSTGGGSYNGVLTFDPLIQNQRSALTLANGNVYIAWASHCESGEFHGWMMAYDATTLAQNAVWLSTNGGWGGGIWMSGVGPTVDADGFLYATTSEGDFDMNTGGVDVSQSLVKMEPSLALHDWFTPFDYKIINQLGDDLGSTGVLAIPGTTLLLYGGKGGKMYVNDAQQLGHWDENSDSQIVQSFSLQGNEIHGSPVAWNLPSGPMVYVWASGDSLRSFQLSGGQLVPVQTGPAAPSTGQPGGVMSLSANGSTAGSGVLWATIASSGDAEKALRPGTLMALDPMSLNVLWTSLDVPGDDFGTLAKFNPPTVTGGRVYLPSFDKKIWVYGLK